MTTKIEWATDVWNPVTGCTPISEGCQHCYAKRMSARLKGRFGYPKDEPFKVTGHPDKLQEPFFRKKPKRIFVCSMGDLFHPAIVWNYQYKIFETMLNACWHTFMILTKRPEIMAKRMENTWFHLKRNHDCHVIPLLNVWLGVSVELQKYDHRITELIQIPAAVRFVSLEPMLGPIDLAGDDGGQNYFPFENEQGTITPGINWVIVGGLSLPGGKIIPPKREWLDSIVEQCSDAGIPIFLKDNAQYPIERREFPKEDKSCPG